MFSIGVFAVILNRDEQVLLCHRTDRDMWNLPGGRLEEGETPWQGVEREVEEETGFRVRPLKLFGIYAKPKVNEVVFCFLCVIVSGDICLNEEADQIVYFSEENLPENLSQNHRERVRDALSHSPETFFRVQEAGLSIRV